MFPKGLITQIGMLIISASIIFTYIQPAFGEVAKIQDNIQTYKVERDKVVIVNSQLSKLVADMESVSPEDQRKLLTYMPDSVDELNVLRDLHLITQQSGVLYKDVRYMGPAERGSKKKNRANSEEEFGPDGYQFGLSVEGTYDQLKNLFRLVEQNNYPLEVQSVAISKLEGGFLGAEIIFVTYSFQSDITSEPTF